MNKFTVWDKTLKCFHLDGRVKLENGTLKPIGEDYTIHNNIGLKDINGKSIYADSSIVEFQWINGFGNVQTDWGVFKYDINYLQYLIYEENEDINKSSIKDVLNIKIIDTIQENKLGLIKA